MSSYTYPENTIKFSIRDTLARGNPEKVITGAALDVEFEAITTGKLDKDGTDFEGTIANASAVVDGGTF